MSEPPWSLDSSQFTEWIAAYELDCGGEWTRTGVIAAACHNAAVLMSMATDKEALLRKPKDFMPKYGKAAEKARYGGKIVKSSDIVRSLEGMFGTGGAPRKK